MNISTEQGPIPVPTTSSARDQDEKLLRHFGFRESPFGVTPNPAFLFSSGMHRAALQSMIQSIESNLGFTVLLGGPGMGKTTLLLQLLTQYRDSARTAFIFQTQCKRYDLLRFLASELELPGVQHDEVGLHQRLKEMLVNEAHAGRKVLIFIDEAQNLRHPSLEAIRLLSDFETARTKLLHIILAGSAQLGETLLAPELSQLAQRIATVCRLEALTPQEVNGYVTFRLGIAGCRAAEHLFSPQALAEVAQQSEGIPRVVNSICYRALVRTYAGGERRVSVEMVHQAARDLDLAHPSGAVNSSFVGESQRPECHSGPNADLFFEEEKHEALNPESPSPELRDAFKKPGVRFPPTATFAVPVDRPPFPQPQARGASETLPESRPKERYSFEAAETNLYSGPPIAPGLKPGKKRVGSALVASSALIVLATGLGVGWYELQVRSGTARHDSDALKPIAGPVGAQNESSPPLDSAQIYSPNAIAESNANPADRRRINRSKTQAPIVEAFSQGLVPPKLPAQRENPIREPSPATATNISKVPDSLTVPVETKSLPGPPETRGQVAIAEIEESTTANQSAEDQTAPRQPIKVVRPMYPKLAELRRIEGDVVLELQVDPGGKVQTVRTLSGNPLLGEAAQEATRQWQFPRSENETVSTFTRVKFNFKLPAETNR